MNGRIACCNRPRLSSVSERTAALSACRTAGFMALLKSGWVGASRGLALRHELALEVDEERALEAGAKRLPAVARRARRDLVVQRPRRREHRPGGAVVAALPGEQQVVLVGGREAQLGDRAARNRRRGPQHGRLHRLEGDVVEAEVGDDELLAQGGPAEDDAG